MSTYLLFVPVRNLSASDRVRGTADVLLEAVVSMAPPGLVGVKIVVGSIEPEQIPKSVLGYLGCARSVEVVEDPEDLASSDETRLAPFHTRFNPSRFQ